MQCLAPKTLVRGLRILDTLQRVAPGSLSIPEISKATEITRPTVYRYIDVLTAMDYVLCDHITTRYRYNSQRNPGLPPSDGYLLQLKQCLRRISQRTGDSSFLIERSNLDSHCLHREVGTHPLQVLAISIGYKQPLGVGAASLALLASQDEHTIQEIIKQNADRLGHYGGMNTNLLERLVKTTQTRGWSVIGNAAVSGVLGVGVAVPARSQHPIFAISVSSILERMTLARQKYIAQIINEEITAL